MTYFNTTDATARDLAIYRDKARKQDDRIRAFFDLAAEFYYTPSEVLEHVFPGEGVPITSVRRSMTVLTAKGILIRSHKQRRGPHGRPEYCWVRRGPARQIEMILEGREHT